MQNKKGFTIIELIVVIAIIAVLAAVVLVNVTGYINKGKDAAARGNLGTLLTNGAMWFDRASGGDYDGFCTNTTYTTPITTALTTAGYTTTCTCLPTNCVAATKWCASVVLKTDATKKFCVDSSGKKSESTTAICAAGACPD